MFKHCVFLNFKSEISLEKKELMMKKLENLGSEMDGMLDMSYGKNLDFESKTPDYDYGFIITFKNKQASEIYANNDTHQLVGAELVASCNNGYEGIIVFDLEI